MDKQILKYKLLSYKRAFRKAKDKGDKKAVKSWADSISELEQKIEETV